MLIHIDGDAFFASVYQATHAHARGKPVAIGQERGIVTAVSYEAKALGVRRGMFASEAKRVCPSLILATSDYRAYQVFSNKMVDIVQQYSPAVERYSIDEVFMDVTNLDSVYGVSFEHLGHTIKHHIEQSLSITVSVGIAQTKTLTKIASNARKPSGLVCINENNRTEHLIATPIEDVWGIGHRLTRRMDIYDIETAYDLAHKPEAFIRAHFTKPVIQTWYELQNIPMIGLASGHKTEYQSIQKTATVLPATSDPYVLFARLCNNIEHAFVKARRYAYKVGTIDIFLKTQAFTYAHTTIRLPTPTQFPFLIRDVIHSAFMTIYKPHVLYRASGCTLSDLDHYATVQQKLFDDNHTRTKQEHIVRELYVLFEKKHVRFGTDLRRKKRIRPHHMFKVPSLTT